ncbi:hypothetical protein SPBR_04734 [Sporothrix brasiliensis 5110]|uniref:WHIM1 domain-containing protein n=1 Tax=Sporothrix brasiliensis 5110 TaxID=1398154 RepID=A0A0C2IQ91_9PEZI|nr:uncharacterized protein SPBR_04734 [Sporothrix brasiliensis 5110]KIH87222.1 hypothetical protein SPBR_04734 [Sporothrix brasiliensis 5110]
MSSDDELSDLSSLSSLSPAPSDDESDLQLRPEKGILKFFHKVPKPKTTIKLTNKNKGKAAAPAAASVAKKNKKKASGGDADKKQDDSDDNDAPAAKREREPSPPHEYVLADNQDIATAFYELIDGKLTHDAYHQFIVLFRNRFAEAFSKNMVNFGPQELERDIVDSVPSERVEYFLCALLKLLLNRQQDVKPGHYHRALEEAIQSHKSQWVSAWKENPLADGKTFQTMTPAERLTLLRALVLWAMSSSKVIRDIIDQSYKGKRKDEDADVSVSVQSWGNDSDKRRYYLVEGRDDTAFRVYRESNPAGFINRTWWSVAGSIDEIKVLIERLETHDGGPKARKLAKRLQDEIPRFEATEEKRRRREYRQQQRDRFKRPEPGFSLYEGRTRGKRIKYTYSDDEEFYTDSTDLRRSSRNTGTHTPAESVTTASGRQIRAPSRLNGGFSATASVQGDSAMDADAEATGGEERELSLGPTGRPRRSAAVNHSMNGWNKKQQADEYDEYDSQADEEDEEEEDNHSEPDLGDDEEDEDEEAFDEDKDAMLLDDEEEAELADKSNSSVMVKLPVKAVLDQGTGKWEKGDASNETAAASEAGAAAATYTQRLSGASTPVNGNSKDHDYGDADATMTGSITQGSDATATSPVVQHVTPTAKDEALADKPVDNINNNDALPEDAAKEPVRAETPGKENGVHANATSAALAYRGSPEKTHQTPRPVDVPGN